MTYDMTDDELADTRELEAAAGELRSIAGGPGGWAAGTVMDEYDRMRAELAEAKAEIARLTEQREEFERQLFWQRGVDANIVEAARTYVGHEKGRLGITNDETAGAWVDRHNELFRTLVAAVEEGKRT